MTNFSELAPEEQARQLRDPEGAAGLAAADALADINRNGNLFLVGSLGLTAGDTVLEVGCGLGTMAATVVAAAEDINYVGLDLSETMIDAARERHRALIDGGQTRFHLGSTEEMPFADGEFSKVFAAGVIHFWPDPACPLAEVRRVMRSGGTMSMGCLAPTSAPPFAKPEYGFHLRSPDEWKRLALEAGYVGVQSQVLGEAGGPQMIHLLARKR